MLVSRTAKNPMSPAPSPAATGAAMNAGSIGAFAACTSSAAA